MSEDLEKTNLEAHVMLCALRFQTLEGNLKGLETSIAKLDTQVGNIESGLNEIKLLVVDIAGERNKQVINWGIGIIATLIGALAFIVYEAFIKQHILTK